MGRMLRLSVLCVVVVLAAGACSGSAERRLPGWVRNPPQYLSCKGMVDPQLVVDVMRAAELAPIRENVRTRIDLNEPFVRCLIRGSMFNFSVTRVDIKSLAGAFSPPDRPQLVPIGTLHGFVTYDSASLYGPCTRGGDTAWLESDVDLLPSDRTNPRARVAMARLVVAMMNSVRQRIGCAEEPLPLPRDLPAIPDPGPIRSRTSDGDGGFCDTDLLTHFPGYRSGRFDQMWVYETPGSSSVLSTCEVRVGPGGTSGTDGFPGLARLAVVTYRGILARAYRRVDEYAMPRYDITCHGEPVSYRVYVYSRDEERYVQAEEALQEGLASAAAARDGCPLPEQ